MAGQFRVGDWEVDAGAGRAERGGTSVRLEPKVAAVLEALVRRGGQLVTRQTLLAEVWPDTVVGEDALTRCIAEIRRALGDDARRPTIVETVPRRGFRVVARIELRSPSPPRVAVRVHATPPVGAAAAAHVADLLTGALVESATVRVLARADASADVVVDASVHDEGATLRLAVRVVDGETGEHLWAHSVAAPADALRSVAASVARDAARVVTASHARAAPVPPRVSGPALAAFMRAEQLATARTLAAVTAARDLYREALRIDDRFLLAHLGLVKTSLLRALVGRDPPDDAVRDLRRTLERLRELAPGSRYTRIAEGFDLLFFRWRPEEALPALREAASDAECAAMARIALAGALALLGRKRAALDAARQAAAVDPLDLGMALHAAEVAFDADERDTALRELAALATRSGDAPPIVARLARALSLVDRHDDARAAIDRLPSDLSEPEALAVRGLVCGRAGDAATARTCLERLEASARVGYVPAVFPSHVCVGLGDHDAALAWLARGLAARGHLVQYARIDPCFDPLRGDPRFDRLVHEIAAGGPAESDA